MTYTVVTTATNSSGFTLAFSEGTTSPKKTSKREAWLLTRLDVVEALARGIAQAREGELVEVDVSTLETE